MLIVSAGNDDGLGLERVESGGSAGRACADGVVYILHAAQLAHKLQPMLHTAEAHRDPTAVFIRNQPLDRRECGQIVLYIVLAGEFYFILVHETAPEAVYLAPDAAGAVFDELIVGKIIYRGVRQRLIIRSMPVAEIQHEPVVGSLLCEDRALGIDIILIVLVLIKMVRRDVSDDRDVRAAVHAVQLEAAELQHGEIIRQYVRRFA